MDCIVVGGGSAGAMAALALARKGLQVELFEQRGRTESGARWHNDVERGLFAELCLGTPPPGVVVHEPTRFVMTTSCRSLRHVLNPHPAMGVDMPSLCSWLLDEAEAQGVVLRFETRARIGRYTGAAREVFAGSKTLRVPVVVDARGLGSNQRILGLHPALDVCDAHQAVYEITGVAGARDFLERNGISSDDVLSIAGVEAGYSVLHVSVSLSEGRVSILGGSQPLAGRRSGRRIVEDFAAQTPWIGERLCGGGTLIPLRPTSPTLVEDGLVRVGDAAGQVLPPTGSGVALQLRAASTAACVIAATLREGHLATAARLWPYNLAYQRGPGAVCAAYQPLRYVISSLSEDEVRLFLAAGIVGPKNLHAAYENRKFSVGPGLVLGTIAHLPQLTDLLPTLGGALVQSALLERHYRAYPRSPSGLKRWARKEASLMDRAAGVALARAA